MSYAHSTLLVYLRDQNSSFLELWMEDGKCRHVFPPNGKMDIRIFYKWKSISEKLNALSEQANSSGDIIYKGLGLYASAIELKTIESSVLIL